MVYTPYPIIVYKPFKYRTLPFFNILYVWNVNYDVNVITDVDKVHQRYRVEFWLREPISGNAGNSIIIDIIIT